MSIIARRQPAQLGGRGRRRRGRGRPTPRAGSRGGWRLGIAGRGRRGPVDRASGGRRRRGRRVTERRRSAVHDAGVAVAGQHEVGVGGRRPPVPPASATPTTASPAAAASSRSVARRRAAAGSATRGGLDERLGQRGPAGLLEQQRRGRPRRGPGRRPPREREPDDAHLGELRPQSRRGRPVVVPRGAHDLGRALLGQQVAHGVAKASWSSVKAKRIAATSAGRPSTRSAMMLRWISLVPA